MKKIIKLLFIGLLAPNLLWADRFLKNGEVVYDSKTELGWQSMPSSQRFAWSQAVEHCQESSYGGYSDWRLPNLYELKSLVDYTKYNPAIATSLINVKTDNWYWSSSKYVSDPSYAWYVNFNSGFDNWLKQSDTDYVLCVRGQ